MRIKKFVIGMVGTNCYVVYNENTKECFVVDPAAPSAPLVEFIQTEGLQLQGILLTHGHFDHIMGIDTLRREWSVPVYASALEQKVLTDANVNLSVAYGAGYVFADAKFLEDGASLALAGYQIRMMLLYRRRGGSFQRRYTVCRLCWKNRFSDRQYEYTGAFGKRAIAEPSGRYTGVSGTYGGNNDRI